MTIGTGQELELDLAVRATLTDDIVEKLIAYIADNKLKGGDALPSERQFLQALGVSRLPLREALSRLTALGVISTRQGKASVVRDFRPASILRQISPIIRSQGNINIGHMKQVRLCIEPPIARIAAEMHDSATLDAIASSLDRMQENLDADLSVWIPSDMWFHRCVAAATLNPALVILMGATHDIMLATQWSYPKVQNVRERSLAYHRRIFEAIEARDGSTAETLMREHLSQMPEGA